MLTREGLRKVPRSRPPLAIAGTMPDEEGDRDDRQGHKNPWCGNNCRCIVFCHALGHAGLTPERYVRTGAVRTVAHEVDSADGSGRHRERRHPPCAAPAIWPAAGDGASARAVHSATADIAAA